MILSRGVSRWASALGFLSLLVLAACQKVPLLAPTGSTITLTASTNVLSANGSLTIIAQVLEAAGTPPHSGTRVTFTTSMGRIEPAETSTDVSGRATVTFVAGGSNGTATIAALSGGATTGSEGALRIAIGSAAVGRVTVDANPTSVPARGGSSRVTAFVLDVNGNALVGTPVSFSTTAGSLSANTVSTDAAGLAATTITTTQAARVTATVGVQSTGGGTTTPAPSGTATASIDITVLGAPSILITPPTTISRGVPATFTFNVTAPATGAPISSVTVDWGDGSNDPLGSVSGTQSTSHTFRNDGAYRVSARVFDSAGGEGSAQTTVNVINSLPAITITPPSSGVFRGLPSVFTIGVQPPSQSGISVNRVSVDWGDGSADQSLGQQTGSQQVTHIFPRVDTFEITVSVRDSANGETQQSTSVVVTEPPLPSVSFQVSQPSQTNRRLVTISGQVQGLPTGVTVQKIVIDFGDPGDPALVTNVGGNTSFSQNHTYTAAASFLIRVTVTDSLGREASQNQTVDTR